MVDFKDPGLIVVAVVFALFYLRLALLRGKRKRMDRDEALKRARSGKKKGAPALKKDPNATWFRVSSWWLVGLALLLMCLGVAMKTSTWFPELYSTYWWVPVGVGGIVFAFSVTV